MFISDAFNEIKNEFDNNKNSHSYMFYTNDFFSCQKDVNKLVEYLFNVSNLNLVESDYIIIKRTDKKNILKDDMQDLKIFFQNTSYLNKYRVYLIEEAHKLNATTSNMILKFLEEPMDRVIAFFITTNLDAVLPTIKSRCQIINSFYEEVLKKEIEDISFIRDFFCNSNKYFSIIKAKKYFEKYDRNELIEIFTKYLEYCYNNELVSINLMEIKKFNRAISMLNNNVSVDYVFDYVFLESSGKNEISSS